LARRNNKSRTGASKSSPPQPPVESTINFVTPTEFVELPSKGRFYPEGHPFHRAEEIEINFMTAKEEDILSSTTLLRKGIMLDRFIESVLVNKSVDAQTLYSGDRNAILLHSRITGYGSLYETRITCPSCNKASDYTFDLSEYGIDYAEDIEDTGLSATPRGTYILEAPKSKVQLEIKLLDGKDEKYLTRLSESKKKNNLLETPLTDMLKMLIISVNGDENRKTIEDYVNSMPAFDSRYIRNIYAQINPNIDLTKDFSCSICGNSTQLEVPLSADFFWPK